MVHIRKDHFFIQTAYDKEGPWHPMRHGECAYNFEDGKWYGITIEFIKDQAIAHLNHEYIAYAQHPMIDKERTYFAFQVDQAGASLDNLQVFHAGRHPEQTGNHSLIKTQLDRFPLKKTVQDQHDILKKNLHARLYMDDENYRKLIERVENLDQEKIARYPDAFFSNKEFQKKIQSLRKELHQNDPEYKKILFSTFQASRALDQFLVEKNPKINDSPHAQKKAVLEETRLRYKNAPEFQKLSQISEDVQHRLEKKYPQLFVSKQVLSQKRERARKALKDDPQFKELITERSKAYAASIDYLYQNNSKLNNLKNILDEQ